MNKENAAELVASLTPGQRDVLDRIALHKSSKEIARELDISPHTVDQRVKAAWIKLGAYDRTSAARKYMKLQASLGAEIYESLVYERSDIDPSGTVDQSMTQKPTESGHFVFRDAQSGFPAEVFVQRRGFLEEFDQRFGRWGRIGLIVACAFVLALVFLLIVSIGAAIEDLI